MRYLMIYFKGFYMSLGMFCWIPLPFHIWDKKLTAIMITCFPMVGLIIGIIWWSAAILLFALEVPMMLTAVALNLMPFLIAGFMHLDGYMDTSDALLSRRPLEERLRILTDSNVGAFAVIMLGILFLLQFSAMHEIIEGRRYFALVIAISVMSRCCSVLSIFTLRHIPKSNYAAMLSRNVFLSHKVFVLAVAMVTLAVSVLYASLLGFITVIGVVLGYAAAIARVYKGFKGISGDLLGYSQVIGELCGLIALAVFS